MRTRSVIATFTVVAGLSAALSAQTPPVGRTGQPPAGAPGGQGGRGAPPAPTPSSCGPNPPAEMKNVAKDSRCFEMRTYTVRAEGPGTPDLIHARFREHTLRIFKKHDMTVVGFWQPVTKPETLVYILAFKDGAARDAAWAAFNADPEWVKVRTDMRVGLQVENMFMIATDYGPLK